MSARGPIMRGNCTWDEIPGLTIDKNEFEIDILNRPFMGPMADFQAWIRNYPKYSADSEYRTMARTTYRLDELEGGMAKCTLQYKGLLFGEVPTILPVTNVVIQSTQLVTDNTDDGVIEVQYYAPETVYRYVLASNQGGPLYTATLPTNLSITPFNPRPADYQGKLLYTARDVVVGFRKEQQGLWFTYEVTVHKLVQATYQIVTIENGGDDTGE